jgi:DNA-binding GntR family transcriptional regulator
MYRYRLEYLKDARSHSILISEHEDIINKIEKNEVEGAKAVIRQHIQNQEKGIVRLLNK